MITDEMAKKAIAEVAECVTHSLNDPELRRSFQYFARTFLVYSLYTNGGPRESPEDMEPATRFALARSHVDDPDIRAAILAHWPAE
jgi:hypothetical protein